MTTHPPDDGAPLSIAAAMDLAVDLARRGPLVDPNPRVGAVLLDTAGRLLGSGYHRGSGTPHAEVAALADAASRGRSAVGQRKRGVRGRSAVGWRKRDVRGRSAAGQRK